MATVGELLINLKADTASIVSDMRKAREEVVGAVEGMTSALKNLAAGAGLVELGEKLRELVSSTVELGTQAAVLSKQMGLSVESTSALSYAAKQTDTPIEAVAIAFKKLSVNMLEAASGNKMAQTLFQALHVQVQETTGALRPAADVFRDVARALLELPDGAARSALEVRLFGRSGTEIANMLPKLAEGIRTLEDEARKAGALLGEDFTKQAEKAREAFVRFDAAATHLKAEFGSSTVFAGLIAFVNKMADLRQVFSGGGGGPKAGELLPGLEPEKFALSASMAQRLGVNVDAATKSLFGLDRESQILKDLQGESGKATDKNAESIRKMIADLQLETQMLGLDADAQKRRKAELLGAAAAQLEEMRALQSRIGIGLFSSVGHASFPGGDATLSLGGVLFSTEAQQKAIALNNAMLEFGDELGKDSLDAQKLMQTLMAPGFSALPPLMAPVKDSFIDIDKITKQFELHAIDAFAAAIAHGKGFTEVLRQLYQEVVELIVKLTVMKTLESAGVSLGGFSLPGFAAGGAPTPGMPILVGEQGPEVFVPGASGTIVPNSALGGGAGGAVQLTQHIDLRGADASAEARIYQAIQVMGQAAYEGAVRATREISLRRIPGTWTG